MTNDLISRTELLKKECCGRISGDDVRNAPAVDAAPVAYTEIDIVREQRLPSATVSIKRCRTCGVEFVLLFRNAFYGYYCPRCGAKTREVDDAQE